MVFRSRAVAEAAAADIIDKMGWQISKIRRGDVKKVVDTLLQDLEPTDPARQFLSHQGVVATISRRFEPEARSAGPEPLTLLDLIVFILMQVGVVLNTAKGVITSKHLPFELASEDLVTISSAIFTSRGSLPFQRDAGEITAECPFEKVVWLSRASACLEHTPWMRRLSPFSRRGRVSMLFDCIATDSTEISEGRCAKLRQRIQNRESEFDTYLDKMAANVIASQALLPGLEASEAQLGVHVESSDRAPKRAREGENDTDEGSQSDGE